MRRLSGGVFVAVVTTMLASGFTHAQVSGGSGRRSGFGSGAYTSGGPADSVLRLAGYPEVQKDLQLDDDQRRQIKAIASKIRAMEREMFDGRRDKPVRDRIQWTRERMAEIEEARAKGERRVTRILSLSQQERLNQIRLQVQGTSALFEPEAVQALKLTASQQRKLDNIRRDTRNEINNVMMQAFQSPREQRERNVKRAQEKTTEVNREAERKMLAVLTPRQKKTLEELKGPICEMERRIFERGGYRGGSHSGGGGGPGSTSSEGLRGGTGSNAHSGGTRTR